ncbi:MAG: DUF4168 domain-containing protein [Hyphomonadaceae bacterium]
MKLISLTAASLLALTGAACATNGDRAETAAPAAQTQQAPAPQAPAPQAPPPAQQAQTPPAATSYTDAQLRAFLAANREINALMQQHQTAMQGTPEQRAQAEQAVQAGAVPILQRHSIEPQTYNANAQSARTDQALRARLTALNTQPAQTPPGQQ